MPGDPDAIPSSAADLLQVHSQIALLGSASPSLPVAGLTYWQQSPRQGISHEAQAQPGLCRGMTVTVPSAHHPAGLSSKGCSEESPLPHQEGNASGQAQERAAHTPWLHTPVSPSSIKCHKSREISR